MFLKSNALPRLDLSNILLSWKEKELHWKHNSNLNPYPQCFTVTYPDIFWGYFLDLGQSPRKEQAAKPREAPRI